jgi:hypothetical protein
MEREVAWTAARRATWGGRVGNGEGRERGRKRVGSDETLEKAERAKEGERERK